MQPMQRLTFGVPTRQAWSLLEEFKRFAFQGNVIDLAVGMIIGTTFGKIIDSLVKHILMPLISVLLPGQHGYLAWKVVIHGKEIPYGLFLGEVGNFLLVALIIFVFIVKLLGWLMQARQAAASTPPPLTKEQELLTEIRDLLQAGGAGSAQRRS